MPWIDLHCHSTASDGTSTPAEVAQLGAAAGLDALALTDHDTTAGLREFLAAAAGFPGFRGIPGVEISTVFGSRELHIVGLFIDPESPELNAFLGEQRTKRALRNELMLKRLASIGYELSPDEPEFARMADRSNIGRPHFAAALVRRYGFATNQEVFEKLLGFGRPGFVRREMPNPSGAIAAIRAAGGVPVWAHPTYRQRNERAFIRRIIRRFQPLGLEGIEAYYSLFGPEETALVSEVAAQYGLALSGGSDFHSLTSSNLRIGTGAGGLRVPSELLPELEERRPVLQ